MNSAKRPRRQLTSAWMVLAFAAFPIAALAVDENPEPWGRRPYRVRVAVTFEADPVFTGSFQNEFAARLREGIGRSWGPLWALELHANPENAPRSARELTRMTAAEIDEPESAEQSFWLVVSHVDGRVRVSGRGWMGTLRFLRPVTFDETFDRRAAADIAVTLLAKLFQPLLEVTEVRDDQVTLSLRGGDLPALDADRPQLSAGAVLSPSFRYLDRTGRIQRIQTLPWTYLVVQSVENANVVARVATGVRSPLGAKRRRTVELLATTVPADADATMLTLIPRGEPSRPLVAYPVLVLPDGMPDPPPEDAPPPERLLSDRSGRILLRPTAGSPLVWLRVYSGEQLLARVPFVPGSAAATTVELPDDSIRLTVEGELELLKGRLVDVVARRATLVARIRRLARESDWASVDRLLIDLDKMPGVRQFEAQLNAIRTPAMEEAKKRGDRLTEARIRQLTSDAQQLTARYLDADRITALREEIAELRALDAENAPNAGAPNK